MWSPDRKGISTQAVHLEQIARVREAELVTQTPWKPLVGSDPLPFQGPKQGHGVSQAGVVLCSGGRTAGSHGDTHGVRSHSFGSRNPIHAGLFLSACRRFSMRLLSALGSVHSAWHGESSPMFEQPNE